MSEVMNPNEQMVFTFGSFGELRFVYCSLETFLMGTSDREKMGSSLDLPSHPAVIRAGFWCSTQLVTQEIWYSVMREKARLTSTGRNLPAEGISWSDAVRFCRSLNASLAGSIGGTRSNLVYHLPTEAQWELACRAQTTTRWHFGDDPSLLSEYAWYTANSNGHTHPIGEKRPNPRGIYDMYGNLPEWCLDDFHIYKEDEVASDKPYISARKTRSGQRLKILRGGAYDSPAVNVSSYVREAILEHNPDNEPTGIRVFASTITG